MELEIVFSKALVHVDPTLLIMEMENVSWLSKSSSKTFSSAMPIINQLDVTLHVLDVALEATVLNAMSVMLLKHLLSHVFIVEDANLAMLPIPLNVQPVSHLKSLTSPPINVLM